MFGQALSDAFRRLFGANGAGRKRVVGHDPQLTPHDVSLGRIAEKIDERIAFKPIIQLCVAAVE